MIPHKLRAVRQICTRLQIIEMDSERVEEDADASMVDANDGAMFPLIADQRPRRRFLGVQVPTDTVEPGFHSRRPRNNLGLRKGVHAIEVLGEEASEEGQFIYAFFDDNVIRRVRMILFSSCCCFCHRHCSNPLFSFPPPNSFLLTVQ